MTKKELNEQKHMLKVLTENKAHTERLTDKTCNEIFGLPKATVLSNMDTAIVRMKEKIDAYNAGQNSKYRLGVRKGSFFMKGMIFIGYFQRTL